MTAFKSLDRAPVLSTHITLALGLAATFVSAVLPWGAIQGGVATGSVGPIVTQALRPSALLILLTAIGGTVFFALHRRTMVVVGVAGMLWANFAFLFWFFGMNLGRLFGVSVVPKGSLIALQPGVVVAMIGGWLVAISALVHAGHSLFSVTQPSSIASWKLAFVVPAMALLLWGRAYRWTVLSGASAGARFGLDSASLLGGFLTSLMSVGVAVMMASMVSRRRWIHVTSIALGIIVVVCCVIVIGDSSIITTRTERTLQDITDVTGSFGSVRASFGPFIMLAGGLLAVVFGVVALYNGAGGPHRSFWSRFKDFATDEQSPDRTADPPSGTGLPRL